MKKTMDQYSFVNEFQEMQDRRQSHNFTLAGLLALYDYLTEYEDSTGDEIEFDPIALCCEYSEYESAWEAMQQYQPEDMPTVDDIEGMDLVELQEAQEREAHEWLEIRTQVIEVDGGGVIILQF